MRAIESAIQAHPDDTTARRKLGERTKMFMEKYAREIHSRVYGDGLTKEVMKLCLEGNNSFRKVYDVLWDEKIANAEGAAIEEYEINMQTMRDLTASPSLERQPTGDLVELYVQAAFTKPTFDSIMEDINRMFKERMGRNIEVSICPTLKRTSRMSEKSQLKATKPGDVSGVKDIVRAMVVGTTMADINVVIEVIFELHKAKALEIVRKKDRFLEAPSGGGWRDNMVNVCLTVDGVPHICEIQVVHHQMLNARKEMDGHVVYNIVRNGQEMLAMRRGSGDVTALMDFESNLDKPRFVNWHTDRPVKEWEGVISSTSRDEITEIDLLKLDPELRVRHRLPSLIKMSFPVSITKLHLAYMQQLVEDYKYHELSFDVSDRADVEDETLQIICKANVMWKKINISSCRKVTNEGIVCLAKCKQLEGVDLSGLDNVDDKALKAISDAGVKWAEIDLRECLNVTEEGVATLKKKCSGMAITHSDFAIMEMARKDEHSKKVWGEMHKGKHSQDVLLTAAKEGHLHALRYVLHQGGADVSPNKADNWGNTPLVLAIQNGHLDIVQALIEAKAGPNKADGWGNTPLTLASRKGHLDIVRTLIEANADVNKSGDEVEATPLGFASQNGHFDIVRTLIKAKADVNKANISSGYTPVSFASGNGHLNIVRALVEAKADVNKAANDGVSPLLNGSYMGHLEVVRCLVNAGADKTVKDSDGTAYDQACNGAKGDNKTNKAAIQDLLR
jgi:ankyrin repeat protein